MPASDVPWLGPRLREERVKRGISLRALARDVGVSASMISQIETAKSQPSVSTLYAITNVLRISVEDLFAMPESADVAEAAAAAVPVPGAVAVAGGAHLPDSGGAQWSEGSGPHAPESGRPASVIDAIGSFTGGRLGPLVRPDQRQVLELDSGVTWELLGRLPQHAVEFLRITYAPGGTSSSNGRLMRHPGSEYGLLISGELVVTLGFEQSRLHAGDSISFDSSTPHSYHNDGEEPAVGVWFVVEQDH